MADSNLTIKVQTNADSAISSLKSVGGVVSQLGNNAQLASTKLSKLERSIKATTSAATTLEVSTQSTMSSLEKLGAITSSIVAIYQVGSKAVSLAVKAGKELVESYSAQEKAETSLQATLKATGNSVGMSVLELKSLATSFQGVTTYGDETILEVEKLFVSTQKVSKEALPGAISATLDLAAAMGTDATSAAQELAKVLTSPKDNLEALTGMNIQFTDAQKEEIIQLQESNKLYEAQSVVLAAVASSYGGVAQAIAETDTGKLTQIKNMWTDIKEHLGNGLLNVISPAIDAIYFSLKKVSDFANWLSRNKEKQNVVDDYLSGETHGRKIVDFSDEELTSIISSSRYMDWRNEYERFNPEGNVEETYARALQINPEWKVERKQVEAAVQELEKRMDAAKTKSQSYSATADDAKREHVAVASSAKNSTLQSFEDEKAEKEAQEKALQLEIQAYVEKNKNLSVSSQIAEKEAAILEIQRLLSSANGENKIYLEEILSEYQKQLKALTAVEEVSEYIEASAKESAEITAKDLINKYATLSVTEQIAEKEAEINEVKSKLFSLEEGTSEYLILEEVLISLEKELESVKGAVDDNKNSFKEWNEAINQVVGYAQQLGESVTGLYTTIIENQISEVSALIEKAQAEWDSYLSDLEKKQDLQKDSLAHLYDEGLISLEEYNQANLDLYSEQKSAAEEAAKKEEELQKKKSELEKKAFDANKANSIAQALINGAMAITNIWANNGGKPIMAGILTGLSAATIATQIATISTQQFTPMAMGGIITKPTHALLGEGGSKEMVLPLNESNLQKAGLSGKSNGEIHIHVHIDNNYSSEDLATNVYGSIQRLQRDGVLPNWRFA